MDNFDLGEALLKYRKGHRLTQKQMGDMLGMSRQAYDRLEKGYRKPTYEEVQRILKAIDRPTPAADVVADLIPPYLRTWKIYNLRRQLLYSTIKIKDALAKMKDLAKAIESPVLLDWAHCELNGYFADNKAPAYRLYGRSIEVNYKRNGEKIFDFPIPFEMLDPSNRYADMFVFREGMGNWEQMIEMGDGKYSEGGKELFPSMHMMLQEVYGQDIEIKRVSIVTTLRFGRKVLLAIQEILLTFLSDLETKFGREADIKDLRAVNYIVTDLFMNAKNMVGNASHLDVPAKPEPLEDVVLAEGDLQAFCFWLQDHGLNEFDELIEEFFVLLDEQELNPPSPGAIPPKVYDWVNDVVKENSNFGQNGEKLIGALKNFYGVKH